MWFITRSSIWSIFSSNAISPIADSRAKLPALCRARINVGAPMLSLAPLYLISRKGGGV